MKRFIRARTAFDPKRRAKVSPLPAGAVKEVRWARGGHFLSEESHFRGRAPSMLWPLANMG